MSKKNRPATSVTATPPARTAARPAEPAEVLPVSPPRPAPKKATNPLKAAMHFAASLRVTVFLMAGCMVLVLWGTLAQTDAGIDTVVANYFRSFVSWVPLKVVFLNYVPWSFQIPFPGGWTWGTLLLFNLVAAHALRFKFAVKKVGIWVIHSGMIVLMLGELVTGIAAKEYRMVIEEGNAKSYLESHKVSELAIVDVTDSATDKEAVVPERLLKKGGRVSHPSLPVDVQVLEFMPNSSLPDTPPAEAKYKNIKGYGLREVAVREKEVSGVKADESDVPSAYVELFDKANGQSLGTWLVTQWTDKGQRLVVGDRVYEIALRSQRTPVPYTFHLTKFTHAMYEGTPTPKDYRAHVRITEPASNTDRNVEIYMNTPLRFRGKTFYQASFLPPQSGKRGTVLQVVDNPGRLMPYISCTLVSLGMLVHFGIHLTGFLRARARTEGGAA